MGVRAGRRLRRLPGCSRLGRSQVRQLWGGAERGSKGREEAWRAAVLT